MHHHVAAEGVLLVLACGCHIDGANASLRASGLARFLGAIPRRMPLLATDEAWPLRYRHDGVAAIGDAVTLSSAIDASHLIG